MKLIIRENYGEELAAVLNDENRALHFYIRRPERLNLGETVTGIIRKYDSSLNGYFVETHKKLSVFVPSPSAFNEGQHVFVQITKEARRGKDANGVFTDHLSPYPSLAETLAQQTGLTAEFTWDENLDEQLDNALDKHVLLPSGGQLTIERSEACWTIDVDSKNADQPFHKINESAAREIARQLSLRHMGGLILTDFIGSKPKQEQMALEKILKSVCRNDSLCRLLGWTRGRLFEMKRTRTYAPLADVFLGANEHLSALSTAYEICRKVKCFGGIRPVVTANPAVIEMIRPKLGAAATFKPAPMLPIYDYDIKENK